MIFHISDASGAVRFIVEIAICQVCTFIARAFMMQLSRAPVRAQHVLRGVDRRDQERIR